MGNIDQKKKKSQYLVKSKNMVRSVIRAKTTKLGTKLSYYAAFKTVSNFHNNEEVPEICSFKISDFLDIMKVSKGVAYRKIKLGTGGTSTALRSELNKALTFQFSVPKNQEVLKKKDYDENDYETHNIFMRTWIDDGKCFFEVNQKLFREHFIHLNAGEFVTTPLQLVSGIKTDYTIRFYDYFKSFVWGQAKDYKYNKLWKLEELKVLIGIDLSKSYINNIGSLKQKILEPVKKDINENTDILFNFKLVKDTNNKVTAIIFYAKMKSPFEIKNLEDQKLNKLKIKDSNKIIDIVLGKDKNIKETKKNKKSNKNNHQISNSEIDEIIWD